MTSWEQFVIAFGFGARMRDLAHVLGRDEDEIAKLRNCHACTRREPKAFAELFMLWHGRAPLDGDWPKPERWHERCDYEWQPPELALLGSLVGTMGTAEIAEILTARLKKATGDQTAQRTRVATQIATNRIGLQTSDVVGGITIARAAIETGSRAVLDHAVRAKKLRVRRIGRFLVIPYDEWLAWKAKRVQPPENSVSLASLKPKLGITSDKLSEWARMGYIQTAVRCNTFGTGRRSTRWGTWYIDRKVADKLIADRRAGRPMPWHGKPEPGNLRITWTLLQERRHPAACQTCQQIWGAAGAPRSYEDYSRRYPPIAFGAKRHLTRPWNPGLTIAQVAKKAARSVAGVVRAIEVGCLRATRTGRIRYISLTDATRWIARRCPTGAHERSWLSQPEATRLYGFSEQELLQFVQEKRLQSKIGKYGQQRGRTYFVRQQCAELRSAIGYTKAQAATRLGVSTARIEVLLRRLDWRGAAGIPLDTLHAMRKREESEQGYTITEAARELGKPVAWIEAEIRAGTIRILRTKWNRRRRYVTAPMFKRLRAAARRPRRRQRWSSDWLYLSEAAVEAGVCSTTLIAWAGERAVTRRHSLNGWRYHRASIRARARQYWRTVRYKRATPPAWLSTSQQG